MSIEQELGVWDLPSEEMDLLQNALDVAQVHAASGHRADGHGELMYGLRRAEVLQGDGVPWAGELAAGYRRALDWYCERYLPRLH